MYSNAKSALLLIGLPCYSQHYMVIQARCQCQAYTNTHVTLAIQSTRAHCTTYHSRCSNTCCARRDNCLSTVDRYATQLKLPIRPAVSGWAAATPMASAPPASAMVGPGLAQPPSGTGIGSQAPLPPELACE